MGIRNTSRQVSILLAAWPVLRTPSQQVSMLGTFYLQPLHRRMGLLSNNVLLASKTGQRERPLL